MKLVAKRAGSCTSFVDSMLDEPLLQFSWRDDGSIDMAFHLYNALGVLVADSGGDAPVAAVCIASEDGEVLLDVPIGAERHIRYRLYNSAGNLLTASDGARTQIFGFLRMDSRSGKDMPERRIATA